MALVVPDDPGTRFNAHSAREVAIDPARDEVRLVVTTIEGFVFPHKLPAIPFETV